MKLYMIKHYYDVDGEFGDAIEKEDCILIFNDEIDAKLFVKTFENPHVYDKPYDELSCGKLKIEEVDTIDHEKAIHVMNEAKETYWWNK